MSRPAARAAQTPPRLVVPSVQGADWIVPDDMPRFPDSVDTLLIGLGGQKCATTWLNQELAKQPEIHGSPSKEVHFWDSHIIAKKDSVRAVRSAEVYAALQARWKWAQYLPFYRTIVRENLAKRALLLDVISDDKAAGLAAYVEYLSFGLTDARVVMDITPAYARLPFEAYTAMAALHPNTKFLFIMRDPVDRFWSNIGMGLNAKGDLSDPAVVARNFERVVRRHLTTPGSAKLRASQYEETLQSIYSAGVRDQTMLMFYEEMFLPEALHRLADFLGVARLDVDTSDRVNPSRWGDVGVPAHLRAELRGVLAETYTLVEAEMGYLPPAWREG